MARPVDAARLDQLAREVLAALATGQQLAPFSARDPSFDLAEAYKVTARVRDLRKARGEMPIGRKIGFTNKAVWGGLNISGPIWNYLYDSTVHDLGAGDPTFVLGNLQEPRIEPEIVLHLCSAPDPGMDDPELLACLDWVAHGFEIVHSIFPGWSFAAADAAAAFGLHGALLLGARYPVSPDPACWDVALASFTIDLLGSKGMRRQGHGANVLGGPIKALRFLVKELGRYPACEPLAPGELITTGTLTEAMPVRAGQTWSTVLDGIGLPGISVRFC